jgi:hypothetical protein
LIRLASFNPALNNSSDFDRAFSGETTAKMFPIAVPPRISHEEAKIKYRGSKIAIFLLSSYLRSSIFDTRYSSLRDCIYLFQGVAISGANLVVMLDEESYSEGVNKFANTLRAFRQLLQSEFARF